MALDSRLAGIIKKTGRPKGSKSIPRAVRLRRELDEEEKKAALKGKSMETKTVAAAPVPPPPPAPSLTPLASDKELFGNTPSFDRPPENFMGDRNGPNPSPIPPPSSDFAPAGDTPIFDSPPQPEPEPQPEAKPDSESHRPFASMIWDSVVNLLAVMVGPFWQPRKIGGNAAAGEIPYDERDVVILSLCKYLHHVGMIMLSPGQELSLAIANYSMPRIFATIAVLKSRIGKRRKPAANQTADDPRFVKEDLKNAATPPAP